MYIGGLSLHNASWDCNRNRIVDGALDQTPTLLPICWLKPSERISVSFQHTDIKCHMHACPLYATCEPQLTLTDKRSKRLQRKEVMTINMETSLPSTFWQQRDVHLSCTNCT